MPAGWARPQVGAGLACEAQPAVGKENAARFASKGRGGRAIACEGRRRRAALGRLGRGWFGKAADEAERRETVTHNSGLKRTPPVAGFGDGPMAGVAREWLERTMGAA